jgi:hypothetical protein
MQLAQSGLDRVHHRVRAADEIGVPGIRLRQMAAEQGGIDEAPVGMGGLAPLFLWSCVSRTKSSWPGVPCPATLGERRRTVAAAPELQMWRAHVRQMSRAHVRQMWHAHVRMCNVVAMPETARATPAFPFAGTPGDHPR